MINGKDHDERRVKRESGPAHPRRRDAQQITYEEERTQRDLPWSPAESRKYRAGSRRPVGQGVAAGGDRLSGGHRGKGPKGYRRSDERVREVVCELMTEDEFLDASNIEVEVKDGEVTLNGTVPERRAKRYAEDLVEQCSGVTHVQNNLRAAAGR
jgi:osmotically-inducible protein OsmY